MFDCDDEEMDKRSERASERASRARASRRLQELTAMGQQDPDYDPDEVEQIKARLQEDY